MAEHCSLDGWEHHSNAEYEIVPTVEMEATERVAADAAASAFLPSLRSVVAAVFFSSSGTRAMLRILVCCMQKIVGFFILAV